MEGIGNQIVAIATGIIGLAALAVIFSKNSNAVGVINAGAGGLAQNITAAVNPYTQGGSSSGLSLNVGGLGTMSL